MSWLWIPGSLATLEPRNDERAIFSKFSRTPSPICPVQRMEAAMLNHISIGVRDIARAKRFYDATLKALGYACLSEGETSLGYGKDAVAFWISATDAPV